jgi:hypothetical protein
VTPQGMVIPQRVKVQVRWPEGYELGELPEGWRSKGRRTAVYDEPALESQPRFSITGSATAP